MSAPLKRFFARYVSKISSLGKPIASTGVELGRMAAGQIEDILAPARPRFAAFISYSHRDMDCARWLHKAIETYRVPRALVDTGGDFGEVPARLRPVFRDEDELAGAAELGPKLHGALAKSNALIVICSPAAARSIWVDKEIRTFRTLNPGAPVFAVITQGTPGSKDQECFPAALLHPLGPDGELDRAQTLEPLAPDLQKLDRKVVKLKLIAGLLGVDYGSLYDREQRRRRKIAAAVGTFATILIILLSGLSIAAFTYAGIAVKARNAAILSEKVAVRERNAAVAARDLAERRLWLAQRAAEEVRFQMDLASKPTNCPPRQGSHR